MSDNELFPVPEATRRAALIDNDGYLAMYEKSVADPEAFWGEQGKRIDWIKPYTKVKDVSYAKDDLHIKWYYDGTLNVSANCLDRHLAKRGDQTAIVWEGDNPADDKKITYRELHREVCKFANALKGLGAKKGDRITIYMPMIPEAAVAMLRLRADRRHPFHRLRWFLPDALARPDQGLRFKPDHHRRRRPSRRPSIP